MIVSRYYPSSQEKWYGIKGVDMDGAHQLYPYDTIGEALANERLIKLQDNPKDPRFKDPAFVSTLKALDRV